MKSWGNYPDVSGKIFSFKDETEAKNIVSSTQNLIAYGNGRSYGDSALANHIVKTNSYKYFLDFDEEIGLLHLQSGVLLSEIIDVFLPRGWFLQVTPGTKFVTVGGAIASDVHGKNHHVKGCFSECLKEFTLCVSNSEILTCSREENSEFFHATCGGMGLTGIILDAKIYLEKVNSSYIDQEIVPTANLKETLDNLKAYKYSTFSVAWIDCLSRGTNLGRSILILGEFSKDSRLIYKKRKKLKIPFFMPSFLLNSLTVKAFNFFYYHKNSLGNRRTKMDLESFFYPLDAIVDWNKIYGKRGFVQYQLILPEKIAYKGLKKIVERISESGKGSFLTVLKLYGPKNDNWLSFPIKGYSLALDFKIDNEIFDLLDDLDKIVLEYKGRVYLTKDARLSKEAFHASYVDVQKFIKFREQHGLDKIFMSKQSQRLGI